MPMSAEHHAKRAEHHAKMAKDHSMKAREAARGHRSDRKEPARKMERKREERK